MARVEFGSNPLSRWQSLLNTLYLGNKAKIEFITAQNTFYANVKDKKIFISSQVVKKGLEDVLIGAIYHETGHLNYSPIKPKIDEAYFMVWNGFEDIRIEDKMVKRFKCGDKLTSLYNYFEEKVGFGKDWFSLLKAIIITTRGYNLVIVDNGVKEFITRKLGEYAEFCRIPNDNEDTYKMTNDFVDKIKNDFELSHTFREVNSKRSLLDKISKLKERLKKESAETKNESSILRRLNRRKKKNEAILSQIAESENKLKELKRTQGNTESEINSLKRELIELDLNSTHRKLHKYLEELISQIFEEKIIDHDFNKEDEIHIPEPGENYEFELPPTQIPNEALRLSSEIQAVRNSLLKHLTIKKRTYFERGLNRGRLDRNRLWRSDDKIFKKAYHKTKKDVAISLLIDCSGSMHGKKINEAKKTAYVFAEAIKGLNVSFEVLGFTTKSDDVSATCVPFNRSKTEPLVHYIFKKFDGKDSSALFNSVGMQNNCDPDSIVYAGKRLLKRPESKKILIVFSDGQPAWTSIRFAGQNAVKYYCNQLKQLGVKVVGVGIQNEEIGELYENSIYIENVEDLLVNTVDKINQLLKN